MNYQDHFSAAELEVLRQRALRVRRPIENTHNASDTPLIYLWLEEEVYALPILNLVTVHQDVLVVPVPCVPAFVAGVANIRGRVMPVIDLAQLLEVPLAPQASPTSVLVVVEAETREVIFRATRISPIKGMVEYRLKPLPDVFDVPHPEFFAGLLPDGTPQLDVATILKSPVLVVNNAPETMLR